MAGSRKATREEFPAFGDYLKEKGAYDRVSILAEKMVIAKQLAHEMSERKISKTDMAARMKTSRTQLNRVLHPTAQNVTLESLVKAAEVVGRKLRIELI